jgi:hypothetical protein
LNARHFITLFEVHDATLNAPADIDNANVAIYPCNRIDEHSQSGKRPAAQLAAFEVMMSW